MVKEEMSFDSGMTSANCAVFDKSCNLVYVASEDASIKIFNTQTRDKETELKGHEGAVLDLCWDNSPDSCLISAGEDASFKIWQ
jgi:WD40 repeat protein